MPTYKLPVKARWELLNDESSPSVVLKEVNKAGKEILRQLFKKKSEWEKRNNKEYILWTAFELRYQKRTYKQLDTVFALVTAIFESMEGRLPTEEEKKERYEDLKEEYAPKKPSKLTGKLRPVGMSEANSVEAAHFIEGLINHLAQYCEFETYNWLSVSDAFERWHEWRSEQEVDPMDYADIECTRLLTESEWRVKNVVSAASGKGGDLQLHHIVTRGSNKAAEDKAWNWLSLKADEHRILHDQGDDYFLRIYPHLTGRFKRAKSLANRI
jgi:hypothetical protein